MQSIAYEQVNDIAVRKELRRAHGFCNQHAFVWLRESRSVLGTALIFRDVLLSSLRDLTPPEPRGGLLRTFLRPKRRRHHVACPACRAQLESEARYLDALLAVVTADADALEMSTGLCRRHALAVLRSAGAGADALVEKTRHAVEALVTELDEVIRKEDYRFRDEPRTDGERSAPSRAIAWAAGAEGLVEQ
jgi:hypothetical protein